MSSVQAHIYQKRRYPRSQGYVFHWKILTKWPFYPSITRKFCAKKLLVENFRVLRSFDKPLAINHLCWFWRKRGFAGFQKSTPKKNLALPFFSTACLQKRKKASKTCKKHAQNHRACAKIRLFPLIFSPGEGWRRSQNNHFSRQNASSPWTNFPLKDFDKPFQFYGCKQ